MERRHQPQPPVSAMGKSYALPQTHPSNTRLSRSMEDLPIPNSSAPKRNLKGFLTIFDTPKANPQRESLHFAPLKTPSSNDVLRTGETDNRIMTAIQPLRMETRSHKDPSFPSPLRSIQRKSQWSPDTIKQKESPAKVSVCSPPNGDGGALLEMFTLNVQSHHCKWLGFMVVLHHPLMPLPGNGGCPVETYISMVRKGGTGFRGAVS